MMYLLTPSSSTFSKKAVTACAPEHTEKDQTSHQTVVWRKTWNTLTFVAFPPRKSPFTLTISDREGVIADSKPTDR
jgi:hypothetical protein